ncbi:hypothetical protein WN51_05884 [Melipona quadrifasciata]|uniref:Uncharacterized protein n=1 Tax=Melipona quadrifasciata TaxID=166423 RepID=A0A0M9A7E3_9HYME|nr:hypothetical protein WN51_05884 [Melipona quadrifasciata]
MDGNEIEGGQELSDIDGRGLTLDLPGTRPGDALAFELVPAEIFLDVVSGYVQLAVDDSGAETQNRAVLGAVLGAVDARNIEEEMVAVCSLISGTSKLKLHFNTFNTFNDPWCKPEENAATNIVDSRIFVTFYWVVVAMPVLAAFPSLLSISYRIGSLISDQCMTNSCRQQTGRQKWMQSSRLWGTEIAGLEECLGGLVTRFQKTNVPLEVDEERRCSPFASILGLDWIVSQLGHLVLKKRKPFFAYHLPAIYLRNEQSNTHTDATTMMNQVLVKPNMKITNKTGQSTSQSTQSRSTLVNHAMTHEEIHRITAQSDSPKTLAMNLLAPQIKGEREDEKYCFVRILTELKFYQRYTAGSDGRLSGSEATTRDGSENSTNKTLVVRVFPQSYDDSSGVFHPFKSADIRGKTDSATTVTLFRYNLSAPAFGRVCPCDLKISHEERRVRQGLIAGYLANLNVTKVFEHFLSLKVILVGEILSQTIPTSNLLWIPLHKRSTRLRVPYQNSRGIGTLANSGTISTLAKSECNGESTKPILRGRLIKLEFAKAKAAENDSTMSHRLDGLKDSHFPEIELTAVQTFHQFIQFRKDDSARYNFGNICMVLIIPVNRLPFGVVI